MTEFRAYRRALMVMGSVTAGILCGWSLLIMTWTPAQEFLHEYYTTFLWAGLIPGLVASILFLVLHRPSRWLTLNYWNATGWVYAISIFYLRGISSLAWQRSTLLWRGPGYALNSIALLYLVTLLVILRLVSFLQYRLTFRKTQREMELRRAKAAKDQASSRSED